MQEHSTSPEIELAWAAGFFDGEGTTCITRHKPKNQHAISAVIIVSIKQTHIEELERFRSAVGGEGVINGPYQRGKNKPYWMFRASGIERVQRIIDHLSPYMCSTKRDQAKTAIETMTANYRRPGRETKEYCIRSHDLGIGGRTKNGHCRECQRIHSIAQYYRRKGDHEKATGILDGTIETRRYRLKAA